MATTLDTQKFIHGTCISYGETESYNPQSKLVIPLGTGFLAVYTVSSLLLLTSVSLLQRLAICHWVSSTYTYISP